MELSLRNLLMMARFTVQRPRDGARMVMASGIPMPARWLALVLMAVVSSVLAHLAFGLMPAETRASMEEAMSSPIGTALLQFVLMVISVQAVFWVGRWRGGKGTFADAMLLMVWLQFILVVLQVIQIVVQVLLPPVADVIGLASVGLFMWLISNFVAELHGFASVGKTFLGVLATLLVAGFALAVLMLSVYGAGV